MTHLSIPRLLKSRSTLLLLGLTAITSQSAYALDDVEDAKLPDIKAEDKCPWSISAGLAFRKFDGGSFASGSSSSGLSLSQSSETFTVDFSSAGNETGQELRTYDNGFVGPDTSGTTSGSVFEGTTSRFGYDSGTQIQGNSLVYSSTVTGSATTSTLSSSTMTDALQGDDPGYEPGIQINFNYALPSSNNRARFGLNFGILCSPYKLESHAPNFYATRIDAAQVISATLTDSYSFAESLVLPDAPYSQPDSDPAPGPLPRITDTPTRSISSSVVSQTESVSEWFNLLDQEFDADVYSFSFGPDAAIQLCDSVSLSAACGASLHIASWDASLLETLYLDVDSAGSESVDKWNYHNSDLDVLMGVYLQCGAAYQFGSDKEYSLQGFARWDWAEGFEDSLGTSAFDISFDSFTAGISFGYQF